MSETKAKGEAEVIRSEDEQEEYDRLLEQAKLCNPVAEPILVLEDGRAVTWMPLAVYQRDKKTKEYILDDDGNRQLATGKLSSQSAFLNCTIFEALYHGTRGPGKTDTLLMAFAQHVGKGHGSAWRGIIFRQTYPQLADVQAKSERWFRQMFPAAKFNKTKMQWEWPTGEALLFRHMNSPSDYWNYHGHEYPFIGWEELTNWATDECFKIMMSCCRTSKPGVPRMVRSTTNPYGVGHNWVKARYRLEGKWWQDILINDAKDLEGRPEPQRCAIHGHIDENYILLDSDPNYKTTVVGSAANPAMAKAWLHGSWAIVAGGMFGDLWTPAVHILKPFVIPPTWRLDRSFDWGSSKPFSVGWWAESDGSDYIDADGKWRSTVKGDLFRFREWYGTTGKANEGLKMLATEIAAGIVEREVSWGLHGIVKAGPADSSIFNTENGNCIADDMERKVRLDDGRDYRGVSWEHADKRPGSRKMGWEQCRKALKDAMPNKDGRPREQPGMFVFDTCTHFLRTFPSLPRDEKDMDDVDTDAEDHIGDETRYRVREMGVRTGSARAIGVI